MLIKRFKYVTIVKLILLIMGISIITYQFLNSNQSNNYNTSSSQYVFILDVSNSMNTEDTKGKYGLPMNRLNLSKELIKNTITNHPNKQYGLILFSKNSNYYIPPTYDTGTLLTYLEGVNTNILPYGGTNVAAGLKDFYASTENKSIGILLSDLGEKEDEILQNGEIKDLPKKYGKKELITIGVGTAAGGYVMSTTGELIKDNGIPVIDSRNDEFADTIKKYLYSEYYHLETLEDIDKIILINNSQKMNIINNKHNKIIEMIGYLSILLGL